MMNNVESLKNSSATRPVEWHTACKHTTYDEIVNLLRLWCVHKIDMKYGKSKPIAILLQYT